MKEVCDTVTQLFELLEIATKPAKSLDVESPWTQRITFVQERVLHHSEEIELSDTCIYYVYVGMLAIGKSIVEEKKFIMGKTGRKAVSLKTTSLVSLMLMKQRR